MSGLTHIKKHNQNHTNAKSRELIFADKSHGEEYGEVTAPKGNCRFEVKLFSTGEIHNCPLRGKRISGRSKQMIIKDDIVRLVPDIGKGFIIDSKYSPEDVKRLRKAGELSQITEVSENTSGTTIAFAGDIISSKNDVIEINDDVIANL